MDKKKITMECCRTSKPSNIEDTVCPVTLFLGVIKALPRLEGSRDNGYWQYGAKFSGFSSTHTLFHIAPGRLILFIIADEANTFFVVLSQEFSFESWKGNRAVGKAYFRIQLVGGTRRVDSIC
jgi:hypothetical protein